MIHRTESQDSLSFFGFGLVFFAPFLLFNPDFTLLDLLPDCLGYLLLYLSLRKLRDMNSYFEGAASGFFKAAIVSLLRLLSFFVINAVCDPMNAKTWILLLMFGFDIGEILLLFPAWKSFFEGWSYIGFSYPALKTGGRTALEAVRGATFRFLFLKKIITVLPEISVLSEHDFIDDRRMRWYEFTSMFRVFAIAIVLILGIVWLLRFLKFLRMTAAQTEAFAALENDYRTRVVKKTGVFALRKISLSLLFGAGALFATCDVVFDGLNLLPDGLAAVLFLLFFLFSAEVGKRKIPGVVLSCMYLGLTVAGDLLASEFRTSYSLDIVQTEPGAWQAFWTYFPFRVADTLVLCALTVLLLLVAASIAKEHCGYVPDDVTPQYKERKLAEIRHELRVKRAVCLFFTVLARAADFVCDYIRTMNGTILGDTFGLITLLCSFLAALLFLRYAFAIYDHAKLRYMLL